MNASADDRKIFLIVSTDADRRKAIADAVQKHVARTTITFATDGSDATLKIQNSKPHVIVTDESLPRLTGSKLIEWTISHTKDKIACLLLIDPPEEEVFVDEVVKGRVQFLKNFADADKLSKCLSRALNYLSSNSEYEFKLRFLAPTETLLKQGEKADSVYILRRGRLDVTLNHSSGSVALGNVEEGEFVGEMAYVNGEARSANVTAATDCELIQIPIDMMDHLLFQKPAWSKALVRTLSLRLKRTNDALSKL